MQIFHFLLQLSFHYWRCSKSIPWLNWKTAFFFSLYTPVNPQITTLFDNYFNYQSIAADWINRFSPAIQNMICQTTSKSRLGASPRAKLLESEAVNEGLRKSLSRASARSSLYAGPAALIAPEKEASDVIEMAKKNLEKLKKMEKKKKKRCSAVSLRMFWDGDSVFCGVSVGLLCLTLSVPLLSCELPLLSLPSSPRKPLSLPHALFKGWGGTRRIRSTRLSSTGLHRITHKMEHPD